MMVKVGEGSRILCSALSRAQPLVKTDRFYEYARVRARDEPGDLWVEGLPEVGRRGPI